MWIKNVRLIGALTGGIESECGAVRVLDGTIAEVSAVAPPPYGWMGKRFVKSIASYTMLQNKFCGR